MFERLKQITESEAREIEYECQRCGTLFEAQRQVCPECGGGHIDRRDW